MSPWCRYTSPHVDGSTGTPGDSLGRQGISYFRAEKQYDVITIVNHLINVPKLNEDIRRCTSEIKRSVDTTMLSWYQTISIQHIVMASKLEWLAVQYFEPMKVFRTSRNTLKCGSKVNFIHNINRQETLRRS